MALSTKGAARSRARFNVDPASVLTLNPETGERVGLGVKAGDDEQNLVWSVGVTQQAMPVYVIGSAIAAGKVWSADDVIAAFVETGKLAALRKSLAAHDKREEKLAAANGATPPTA